MDLNRMATLAYTQAKDAGFHREGETINVGEKLMLIVSEAVEALEAHRNGKQMRESIRAVEGWVSDEDFKTHFERAAKDTFEDELADMIIRIGDLAGSFGIDIDTHVVAKLRYNRLRGYKHGGKAY